MRRLFLLAGPNGSGKSTLAQRDIFSRLTRTPEGPKAFHKLNADDVARALRDANPKRDADALSLEAAQQIDSELDRLIEAGESCAVETVLSSDKYRARVERAKAHGYWFGLIYVVLRDPALNVERVAQRVAQGGHDVPEDRVSARWERSLRLMPSFAAEADAVAIYDNSYPDRPGVLLVEAIPGELFVAPEADALMLAPDTNPALRRALQTVVDQLAS